jgi:Iron/manganese superoxide dismutases, C-terminal domain
MSGPCTCSPAAASLPRRSARPTPRGAQAVRKAASAARGWVMVGYDLNDGSLFNYITDTQHLWAVYNMVPVLALDVYEHAYARDYGATPESRKQYVEASSPTSIGIMSTGSLRRPRR